MTRPDIEFGYRRLAAAVVKRAVMDAREPKGRTPTEARKACESAQAFLGDESVRAMFEDLDVPNEVWSVVICGTGRGQPD